MSIPGCTIAAIRSGNRYLLASNSDNPWGTRTKLQIKQGKDLKFIGTELVCPDDSLPWSNMITRGINDKGIAFTFSYVDCNPDLYQGGPGFKDFGYHILGSFQSLKEIEHYLRHEPLQVHGNFLFADDLGNLLVCEIHPEERFFEWNPESSFIRTNHFLNLPFTNDREIQETCSILRYQSGIYALGQQRATNVPPLEFLTALLRNHHLKEKQSDWGASTCNHGRIAGTVSSEILDPLTKKIFYCFGPPCGEGKEMNGWGKYVPFQLSDKEEEELTTIDGEILGRGPNHSE
ncbi:carcinine hydrolase/isopenicillin-N N-acyltransferase family protein [Peribacillus frigoritolerans]|uniref:carcinine hydrolase/isopenicillin-N N-acyltransferase family protein n=1 Tax=Peribacillus frigoritolerans TaxID=450367 RepID=UPI002EA561CD|nr:carcinine hydrolase/isopenicillin-N N-acyltransferase family protein [Peribacillus frigoritolerans]